MSDIKIKFYENETGNFEVVVKIDDNIYYYAFKEKWFITDRLRKMKYKKVITFRDVNFIKKHCRLFPKKKTGKKPEKTA